MGFLLFDYTSSAMKNTVYSFRQRFTVASQKSWTQDPKMGPWNLGWDPKVGP